MYIIKGGQKYGFCPGKATWDASIVRFYNLLVLSSELGALYCQGGLSDQPSWFIENLSWFAPYYRQLQFNQRAVSIFGDGSDGKTKK